MIGSSNRFAHAAALAVAEAPAQAYNPLFIYGGTGLGKTHLLQAIGAYVSDHSKGLTTRYVTSETFTNDFINSLRDKRIEGFKHRYRAYDVLLVDDIQFLEGKERFQEEFFHTFNTLYEAGPADRHLVRPAAEGDRDARGAAPLPVRVGADHRHPATRPRDAHRDPPQEGHDRRDRGHRSRGARRSSPAASRRTSASSRARSPASSRSPPSPGCALDVDLAEQVLRDLFPASGDLPEVTIARIQEAVCERFSLTVQELCSQRRSQAVAYPRQVAMYLSRELTDSSLPKIGKEFGGRDHTTVLHANAKITRMISEDRAVYNLVQDFTARIKHRG